MIWLKRCPRCDGDLFENADMYGKYIACLQCGYYLSESEEVLVEYPTSAKENGKNEAEQREEVAAAA